jgi:transcription-repair coupling factor (superfamily II helicase)
VGRAGSRAYAYLFVPPDRALSEEAYERLKTIGEATELGSGFKIAMRDLEIRGAGNILGAEQHGHMLAVGFNLYSKLLRDAVRRVKGGQAEEEFEPSVELKVDAYIPDEYIGDNDMKIDIYKRIRDTQEVEAIDELATDLNDRFGRPPAAVETLLGVQAVRLLSRKAGVKRVGVSDGFVEAEFARGKEPKPSQMKKVLESCDVPLEFDSRSGFTVRFRAPGDRGAALELGRKVLNHFAVYARLD